MYIGTPLCPICNGRLKQMPHDYRLWCITCHHSVHPDDTVIVK